MRQVGISIADMAGVLGRRCSPRLKSNTSCAYFCPSCPPMQTRYAPQSVEVCDSRWKDKSCSTFVQRIVSANRISMSATRHHHSTLVNAAYPDSEYVSHQNSDSHHSPHKQSSYTPPNSPCDTPSDEATPPPPLSTPSNSKNLHPQCREPRRRSTRRTRCPHRR